jgi:hypothetical protein
MITQFLDSITSALKADFLFSSLLPALLFGVVLTATLVGVVGIEPAWSSLGELDTLQQSVYASVGTLALVVFAYLLHSLRLPFRLLWSGQSTLAGLIWGPIRLCEEHQLQIYRRLQAAATADGPWRTLLDYFEARLQDALAQKTDSTHSESKKLNAWTEQIKRLGERREPIDLQAVSSMITDILETFEGCGARGRGEFHTLIADLRDALESRRELEDLQRREAAFELDSRFGRKDEVFATDLGNIVASYDRYSFTRYQIESELFWPRLVDSLPDDLRNRIDDRTVLLDFTITCATLAWLYGIGALAAGHLLWNRPALWLLVGLAAGLIGYLSYRMGVIVARQLGSLVRTAFDLYRLDLMEKFGAPRPPDFASEVSTWQTLSRLVVYGNKPGSGAVQFKLESKPS